MNNFFKVTLIILGIIFSITIIIIIAGFFMSNSMIDSFNETNTFAQAHSKPECIEEMAIRFEQCDGIKCTVSAVMFGSLCTELSKTGKEEICTAFTKNTWKQKYCEPHSLTLEDCIAVRDILTDACK